MKRLVLGIALLVLCGPAAAIAGQAERCQADKLRAVGSFHRCAALAESRAVLRGGESRMERCRDDFFERWMRAEARHGDSCPTLADDALILGAVTGHSRALADGLAAPGASSTCSPSGLPFSYSYMVTNRETPFATSEDDILPAAPGDLTYYTAAGPYQGDDVESNYEEVDSATFYSRLQADLAHAESGGTTHLALYVHGLGNTFSDALTEAAQFGCKLANDASYPGLLIGYSWPSYDALDSALNYATMAPPPPGLTPQPSGSIRDNVLGSRTSFNNLLSAIQSQALSQVSGPVDFSFLSHSEGNYMAMVGMATQTGDPQIDQCLLLAADISAVSLQDMQQGQSLATLCDAVSVYYSGADADLVTSNYEYFQYHLPNFPTRLGQQGPYYFANPSALNPNVEGIDCSEVTVAPAVSSIISVHPSYRFVPEILMDLSETMLGQPHPNRAAIPGTSGGFVLKGGGS